MKSNIERSINWTSELTITPFIGLNSLIPFRARMLLVP
jgi:hypothetical protein